MSAATTSKRSRGRPPRHGTPDKEREDHAVNHAVLVAIAVSVRTDTGGLGRPLAAPEGKENMRKAFRDAARLFCELGHPISEGKIRAIWYRRPDERERRPREVPTESPDRGVPASYKNAARILSVHGATVSPLDVLAWWLRTYGGKPGPFHPFDVAREYHRQMRPIK